MKRGRKTRERQEVARVARRSVNTCVPHGSAPAEPLEARTYFSVSFQPAVGYGAPQLAGASVVAVGPLVRGGRPDLVTNGFGPAGVPEIGVFINKGAGSFASPVLLPYTGAEANGIAIGDFNGDGAADIAVLDSADGVVEVYLGEGGSSGPSFATPIVSQFASASSGASAAGGIFAANFGGASDDLIVNDAADDEAVVLPSDSNGQFGAPDAIVGAQGQDVTSVSAVADFNGDGIDDIAYPAGSHIDVQFGQLGGQFFSPVASYPLPGVATPEAIAAGPLVDGGRVDLVVASDSPASASAHNAPYAMDVLINTGAGVFAPAGVYAPTIDPRTVAIGDFEGDGSPDIAIGDASGNLDIFSNAGNGALTGPLTIAGAGGTLDALVSADFNGDGHADLAAAGAFNPASDDSVFVLLDNAGGAGGSGGGGGGSTTRAAALTVAITGSNLPSSIVVGARTRGAVKVSVTAGAAPVSGAVTIRLYLSTTGSLAGAVPVGSAATRNVALAPSRSATTAVRFASLPAAPAGPYQIVADVVGPSGSAAVVVVGPSLTIAPAIVEPVLSSLAPAPASIAPGKKESLRFTLANLGNAAAAGTAALSISLADDSAGTGAQQAATVPVKVKLKANGRARYKVSFVVPASLSAGIYYPVATLDVAALGDSTAADGAAIATTGFIVN